MQTGSASYVHPSNSSLSMYSQCMPYRFQVLNSPTEWSAPEMHFPDVSHTEEYDARQQRVQSVEAPTSTTSSSNSSPANSPHSMSGQVAATRTASSSSRGRNSAVHSLPHTQVRPTPSCLSLGVTVLTRFSLFQDPKVIDWLEKVSSKK
jgi:hypothetical protein